MEFNLHVIFLNTSCTLRDIIPIGYHTAPRRTVNGLSQGSLWHLWSNKCHRDKVCLDLFDIPLPIITHPVLLIHNNSSTMDNVLFSSWQHRWLTDYTKFTLLPCTCMTRPSNCYSFHLH